MDEKIDREMCPRCKGSGMTQATVSTKYANYETEYLIDVPCSFCAGKGYFDWIEIIKGTSKTGVNPGIGIVNDEINVTLKTFIETKEDK